MRLREAKRLLSDDWETPSQEQFDEAMRVLINNYEHATGWNWFKKYPYATRDPFDSAWKNTVRLPEASLMPFRECRIRNVTIYVGQEYIDELLER